MTKKDFFRILIKIFGLYSLIISIFTLLPNSISYLSMSFDLLGVIWILIVISMICLVYVFLILNPDKFIDYLKLDKGFDDDLMNIGNLSSHKVIMLGSIIIGGFLLVESIPGFLYYTYNAFKASAGMDTLVPKENLRWFTSFINMIIGYLLINNYDWIAKKLIKKEE